jgi:probable O-glycosylation ligase (exosortase A-associated)
MFGVSTLFALYPEKATEQFIHISKIFLMVFLATSLINNRERLHWLLRVISLSLGFYALKGGTFVLLSGGNYIVWGPEGSFLEANNSLGLALAMNLPLLVYLAKVESVVWLRGIMVSMAILSYPTVLATYSRGAWIGLGLVTALLISKSKHKVLMVTAALIIAIVLTPIVIEVVPERMVARYDILVNYEKDDSAMSRFWNWEFCKRVGMAHPMTGAGFNYYNSELYAIYFPEFIEQWGPQKYWTCHSAWLTVLGEHGIFGFLLWVGLIVSTFLSLRRLSLVGREHQDTIWVTQLSEMIKIALVAFMVVGTFVDAAYFDLLYYLIGIVMVLKNGWSGIQLGSAAVGRQASVAEVSRVRKILEGIHE